MYRLITLFLIIWSFTEPNTHRPGQPETTWPIRTKDLHVSVYFYHGSRNWNPGHSACVMGVLLIKSSPLPVAIVYLF